VHSFLSICFLINFPEPEARPSYISARARLSSSLLVTRIPNFLSQPDLVLRLETLAAANRLTVRVRVRACRDSNLGRRYAIWTVDGHRLPYADFPASLSVYSLRSPFEDSSPFLFPLLRCSYFAVL
jgi:hypothetical protein